MTDRISHLYDAAQEATAPNEVTKVRETHDCQADHPCDECGAYAHHDFGCAAIERQRQRASVRVPALTFMALIGVYRAADACLRAQASNADDTWLRAGELCAAIAKVEALR